MLTNEADAYQCEHSLQAGADWFFDKSTEFEKVRAVVQELEMSH